MGSLFSFAGVRPPVLLVTPQQFKIFYLVTEAGEVPRVFTFPAGPDVHLCGSDLGADGLVDAVCISLLRSAPVVEMDDLEMTPRARIAPDRLSPTEQSTERRLRHMRRADETGNGGCSRVSVRRLSLGGGAGGRKGCASDGTVIVGEEKEEGAGKKETAPDGCAKPLDVLKFPWTEVSVFSADGLGLAGGEVESDLDED